MCWKWSCSPSPTILRHSAHYSSLEVGVRQPRSSPCGRSWDALGSRGSCRQQPVQRGTEQICGKKVHWWMLEDEAGMSPLWSHACGCWRGMEGVVESGWPGSWSPCQWHLLLLLLEMARWADLVGPVGYFQYSYIWGLPSSPFHSFSTSPQREYTSCAFHRAFGRHCSSLLRLSHRLTSTRTCRSEEPSHYN